MKILNIMLLSLFSLSAFSQTSNPPIPIEFFFGNNRTSFLLGVNRNVYNKIKFTSSTYANVDYENTKEENEIVMNNTLAFQFHSNVNIGAGIQYHYSKGLVPNISMGFIYKNPIFAVMFSPSFQYLPNKDNNIELMGFIEFKPKLSENLSLYSKAQLMYNQNVLVGKHDRSFANFRLGIKIKNITFGAATRFDYYGPTKAFKENYGGFIKFDI